MTVDRSANQMSGQEIQPDNRMFEVVFRPHGDLVDFQPWDYFAESMRKIIDCGCESLILDLTHDNRMSSNYIGTIISKFKAASEKGIKMVLTNVQANLYEVFGMLKLTEVIPIKSV